ncbi:sugar ABC transporter permease [Muricomes sp. OA1]|uniref:Sugar ABC transporter permease n=1 Tax=Hungatella hathewayi TaxID=154046 RepID=A0A3E2WS34_9FIRM|nr:MULTISPECIES: sugar ABC transporter permease [Clostridia]MCH1972763.1 sugar ABC transporter permease [Muricomes sp. OA1]MEE0199535.1 sugar ABC transporter permease [Muricomes sp.]RGC29504.1 sugar ABC transporter permease [Hungatella hathewayi]GKH31529.1 ABC transporter permease [Faecalicatena contorta]
MAKKKKVKRMGWYALFVLPLLFIFTTVVLIPFVIGIGYAFFSWDGLPLNPKVFVGLDNFVQLFSDQRFLNSAVHTIVFTLLAIAAINILGLGFALMVTTKLKVRNIARTMLFMPYLIGGLILGYIWKFVLGDALSYIGELTGWGGIFTNWLLDGKWALAAMVVVATWQMAGYIMIIYITGIQAIPDDVIEAAQVDGAGFWQCLFKIKFPLLMPSFTICLFMTLSNCLKIFDVNLSLTGGGPQNATEMFAMNIYNEIFSLNNYGYGQAKAIVFFVVVALVTLIQVSITKKREVEM